MIKTVLLLLCFPLLVLDGAFCGLIGNINNVHWSLNSHTCFKNSKNPYSWVQTIFRMSTMTFSVLNGRGFSIAVRGLLNRGWFLWWSNPAVIVFADPWLKSSPWVRPPPPTPVLGFLHRNHNKQIQNDMC